MRRMHRAEYMEPVAIPEELDQPPEGVKPVMKDTERQLLVFNDVRDYSASREGQRPMADELVTILTWMNAVAKHHGAEMSRAFRANIFASLDGYNEIRNDRDLRKKFGRAWMGTFEREIPSAFAEKTIAGRTPTMMSAIISADPNKRINYVERPDHDRRKGFAYASHDLETGMVYTAGTVGCNPDGNVALKRNITQTTMALRNLDAVLRSTGSALEDIEHLRAYVPDMDAMDPTVVLNRLTPMLTRRSAFIDTIEFPDDVTGLYKEEGISEQPTLVEFEADARRSTR